MNIKLQDEINKVTKGVIVLDVMLMIVLLIASTFNKPIVLGIIFGSIIGVLNFRLLAITIEKSITMPVNKAQIYTSSRYVLRMIIAGIVLIVSAKATYLSIVGVAVGLLSPKFVILAKTLLIDKLKRKEA